MLEVTVSGEEALNKRLSALSDATFFDDLIADCAQALFDQVEAAYAPHSKEGWLEKSLGAGPEQISPREYLIKSSGQVASYNIFAEFGSRPHRIYPNKRKMLRWVSGNGFVFAHFVDHPGYEGINAFNTATTNVLRDFDKYAQKHMKDI